MFHGLTPIKPSKTMENLHDKQSKVSKRQDDQDSAVANAGHALHELITFFRKNAPEPGDVHYTLFGMLQRSIGVDGNDHPDEWQLKSYLFVYDCLMRIFEYLREVNLPQGHTFTISIEQPSTSK